MSAGAFSLAQLAVELEGELDALRPVVAAAARVVSGELHMVTEQEQAERYRHLVELVTSLSYERLSVCDPESYPT